MRTIERSTAFKKDFKRIKAAPQRSKDVDALLFALIGLLLEDRAIPTSNREHALIGEWSGYRECHIKPDLLLVYRKPDADTLPLARIGSHSTLFG